MTSPPETARRNQATPGDPAGPGNPAGPGDPAEPGNPAGPGNPTPAAPQRPRRSRVTAALLTAGLLVLIVGVLAYLIVLAQPFADATGGCGGG